MFALTLIAAQENDLIVIFLHYHQSIYKSECLKKNVFLVYRLVLF